jgi:hypothetical protein
MPSYWAKASSSRFRAAEASAVGCSSFLGKRIEDQRGVGLFFFFGRGMGEVRT